jgi:hypothetical protein
MNPERSLSYFGAAVLGAALLALALFAATWTHEMRISIGHPAPSTTTTTTTTPYVQLPTCYSHAQCPWLQDAPAALPSLVIEYEGLCDATPLDGRILKPTHAELNWFANDSTTTDRCPNF